MTIVSQSFSSIALFNRLILTHDSLTQFSLYVHGGRDLKEGSIASMWRLNLTSIHQIMEDDVQDQMSEWELVQTTGRGPGKISHHTVSVRPTKEVIFYGGLRGEDSNDEIFLFNPNTNAWSLVQPSVSRQSTQLL